MVGSSVPPLSSGLGEEEYQNINRLMELEEFYCYQVGTVFGAVKVRTYDFDDTPIAARTLANVR